MSRYYSRMAKTLPAHHFVPFVRATSRQTVADKMNPRLWALAFVGAVVARVDYKNSMQKTYGARVVMDIAGNGRWLKLAELMSGQPYGKGRWFHSGAWYRYADSLDIYRMQLQVEQMQRDLDYAKRNAEAEAERKLMLLSQNTVTRALVHASDNDYCHETAVALISAGHKMPDLELSFTVTLNVTVNIDGNSAYYPLRKLAGFTRGDMDGATGVYGIEGTRGVEDAIREQVMSGEYYSYDVTHTGTSLEWHAPLLRQVNEHSAMSDVTDY